MIGVVLATIGAGQDTLVGTIVACGGGGGAAAGGCVCVCEC